MTQDEIPEVNKSDASDCEACSALESGQCLFHEGVAVGVEVAKKAMLQTLEGDL